MNKLIAILCLTIAFSAGVAAQTDNNNSGGEYKKNEFFVGYSNQQVRDGGERRTFHGVEGSYTRNFQRYFGIKADVAGAFRNDDFTITGTEPPPGNFTLNVRNKTQRYTFMGGIQIKDNATKARFKPFAHALAGIAVTRSTTNLNCLNGSCPVSPILNFNSTDVGFSGAFGGGLDIRINEKFDFRAIQIDYNPIYSDSRVENNVRFGIGIVFK